jgi:hypothetical protein
MEEPSANIQPFQSQLQSNLQTESYLDSSMVPSSGFNTNSVQRLPVRVTSYASEYNQAPNPGITETT